jgi:hypothetical protein
LWYGFETYSKSLIYSKIETQIELENIQHWVNFSMKYQLIKNIWCEFETYLESSIYSKIET